MNLSESVIEAGRTPVNVGNDCVIKTITAHVPPDPICQLEVEGTASDQLTSETGITTTGWYFYDETWSFLYGPYETREIADSKCLEYAQGL